MHWMMKTLAAAPATGPKRKAAEDSVRATIREKFAACGFDYEATADALDLHHQTLRRIARAVKLTKVLAQDRAEAVEKGKIPNKTGRPKKSSPPKKALVDVLAKYGDQTQAAAHFKVSVPTLRAWMREHKIEGKRTAA